METRWSDGSAEGCTVPEQTVPDRIAPEGTAPEGTAPEGTDPEGIGPEGAGEGTRAGVAASSAAAGRPRRAVESARSLLVGTPNEVLARLVRDDPLQLAATIARRLAERHLLMDADLVLDACRARCAREALRWRGVPSLVVWIEERVDRAIDDLRVAADEPDRVAERPLPDPEPSGAFADLARPLGLSPETMARSCARFNRLGDEERELFFRLVLERRSPDALAHERGQSLSALARPARRALEALLAADDCAAHGPREE